MSNLLSSKKIQDYSDVWPDQKEEFIDYQPDPIRKLSEHVDLAPDENFMN
jgi:hypothetical protein